jgi:hypothetical protein
LGDVGFDLNEADPRQPTALRLAMLQTFKLGAQTMRYEFTDREGCYQANAAEQGAWRSSRKRRTGLQGHYCGGTTSHLRSFCTPEHDRQFCAVEAKPTLFSL